MLIYFISFFNMFINVHSLLVPFSSHIPRFLLSYSLAIFSSFTFLCLMYDPSISSMPPLSWVYSFYYSMLLSYFDIHDPLIITCPHSLKLPYVVLFCFIYFDIYDPLDHYMSHILPSFPLLLYFCIYLFSYRFWTSLLTLVMQDPLLATWFICVWPAH